MPRAQVAPPERKLDMEEIRGLIDVASGPELTLLAARMYARRGFHVIPITPNGKGIPATKYNVNYSHATKSLAVVDKWFGDGGQFYGWNIGIACGRPDGTFAIDIDTHKENGLETWRALCEANDYEVDAPTAVTPSGGRHYLFKWQPNCRSSTGKIGPGIDTRGGDETVCRSHIVVWPSTINDREYKWIGGGESPPVPPFVLESMGQWRDSPPAVGRGNEEVTDADVIPPVPLAKVRDMLDAIDPDSLSYEEWLSIGMAIHSQYPGSDGLAVWDEWSKPGKRYKEKECTIRWNGFDVRRGTTMGTLIYTARMAGWQASETDKAIDPIGAMVARFNKSYAVVVTGSDYRILQEQHDWRQFHAQGLMIPRYKYLKKEAFIAINAHDMTEVWTPKGMKPKPSANIWLAHPGRRQYMGAIMAPGGEAPMGYFNLWAGWSVDPEPGNVDIWLDHMKHVVCRGNEEYFNFVIDWMADAVQNPAKPKGVAIILQGIEGAGKGIIFESFGRLFGPHYVHVTSAERLTGRFNANQTNALLVFADEVMWGGNRAGAGVLKALVTERFIEMERKGIDAEMGVNMVRLVAASNEDWVVPAGPESRRWFVLKASPHRIGDVEYFDKLYDFLENNMASVLDFLMKRKITSRLNIAPVTEWLKLQRAETSTQDSITIFWEREVENNFAGLDVEDHDGGKICSCASAYEAYSKWCIEHRKQMKSRQQFYSRMAKYGCNPGPRIHDVRHWTMPDLKEARKQLNLGEENA